MRWALGEADLSAWLLRELAGEALRAERLVPRTHYRRHLELTLQQIHAL